jgi:ankyrin repeat protein
MFDLTYSNTEKKSFDNVNDIIDSDNVINITITSPQSISEHEKIFSKLCYKGYLNIAKILYESYNISLNRLPNLFHMSIQEGGHINICQWLYSLNPDYLNHVIDDNTPFYTSCFYGNLELSKWLYSLKHDYLDIYNNLNSTPFNIACIKGHIELCKWLYTLKPEYLNILCSGNFTPFNSACMNNHLDLCKWLYSLKPDYLDIRSGNNSTPFEIACMGGHLEMCKWLYSLKPDYLNIKNIIISPFDCACSTDNLELCKWLYSLKPDYIKNIIPFDIACSAGKLEICQWLYSIKKDGFKDIKNNTNFTLEINEFLKSINSKNPKFKVCFICREDIGDIRKIYLNSECTLIQ